MMMMMMMISHICTYVVLTAKGPVVQPQCQSERSLYIYISDGDDDTDGDDFMVMMIL
jgi:hypothetical protein